MTEVNFQITALGATALPSPAPRSGGEPAAYNRTDRLAEKIGAGKAADKKADSALTLETVAEAIERYIPEALPNTRLSIVHDKQTDLFIYKSVDRDSGEVVRQYPADEILRFIAFVRQSEGIVVDSSV